VGRSLSTQEGVAPTVERWTPNPTVAGSNPVALTFCMQTLSKKAVSFEDKYASKSFCNFSGHFLKLLIL
jgi:hypothetical protein